MTILPRHVICVLGAWNNFDGVKAAIAASEGDFTFDEEFSQLSPDDRMPRAFEASLDCLRPTINDDDWRDIESHQAVAYILSAPLPSASAERISAQTLILTATLLQQGALAVKSESAGLAHGRKRWLELARRYADSLDACDRFSASAELYRAWVQRPIHDVSAGIYYSVGMHLLGHPDTEVDDPLDPTEAVEWIDLMGLYLVADKPDRPVLNGEGFRLRNSGPRRIIHVVECERYEPDEFFYNPYGYHRLLNPSD